MNVHELNRDQLVELKQRFLCEMADPRIGETVSYGELNQADELVTDQEVFDYYAGTEFVEEDFLCCAPAWWDEP